ncbi:Quercetin 2,3-dioxygenase [Maioricimonas rarisocia]|uniref:Quercetin 2,3-dioxygenase n=1 Tax=Maioricimonas rarisocia TaxID=2528026 RepID=A0A517ZAR0_9PLAN|nr:pirin family protein [Maioricimonas rarisocia]QDU39537.1 Quercetin 2,3-dioxygenase [Maioricimonas rarisocia]
MKVVRQVIQDTSQHWVGDGFPVRSMFSYADGNRFDPFLLLDYAGPHSFPPATSVRGVGEHPHRGFETVTIVYQGELAHRDSTGSHGTIGPGDVQWMTAASGVVHEEFHSERFARTGGTLEMVQMWVNLPASEKRRPPRYQGLQAADIPQVPLPDEGGSVRVIAGQYHGTEGAAKTFTPIDVWDVQLARAGEFEFSLPDGHTALIVLQSGSVRINDADATAVGLVELDGTGTRVVVSADAAARLLFLTGAPIGEPVVGQGPFVMNSRDEIRQAIDDYREGRMGHLDSTESQPEE